MFWKLRHVGPKSSPVMLWQWESESDPKLEIPMEQVLAAARQNSFSMCTKIET